MALGRVGRQGSFDDAALLLADQLAERSVYRLLAEHGDALFGDDYFADLFKCSPLGRPTVPARAQRRPRTAQARGGGRPGCGRPPLPALRSGCRA